MSGAQPALPAPPAPQPTTPTNPPAVFMSPSQKVVVLLGGLVVLGGLGLLVSGKISMMPKKEPAKFETALIKDMNVAPLTPPKFTDAPPRYADQGDRRQGTGDTPLPRGILSNHGGGSGSGGGVREAGGTLKDASDLDPLERSLVPSKFEGTSVIELPDPTYTIAHGRLLQCSQQTKMNSTLAGGVTAIIPREIRSDTGDVTLLDKGATVFGTIGHALLNGEDRLAVLWQDISTPILYDASGKPHRYSVTTNSPFASELGETGADGDVNRHIPLKVGALLGYSFVQGATQYAVQSASKQDRGGSQINLNSFQQGGDQAAQIFLADIVRRPDVMTRDQALPCAIFLMRDLNLRKAYALRLKYRTLK